MLVGAGCMVLSLILAGVATGQTLLFISRVLLGIGAAGFSTITPAYVKDLFVVPTAINKAFSLLFAAVPVGAASAFVVMGSVEANLGWRSGFLLCAVPLLALSLFLCPLKPLESAESSQRIPVISGLVQLWQRPRVVFAIAGYILNSFALNGIATFVNNYGVSIGFELSAINMIFGLILVVTGFAGTWIGGALSSRYVGKVSDQGGRLLWFAGVASAIAFVPCSAAFVTGHHEMFLAFCFLTELFVFASVAPLNTVLTVECPPALVTFTQGISIMALNLFGSMPAPVVLGRIADAGSLGVALQLTAIALLCGALLWLWGARVVFRKV